jgi:hypothetical protein
MIVLEAGGEAWLVGWWPKEKVEMVGKVWYRMLN